MTGLETPHSGDAVSRPSVMGESSIGDRYAFRHGKT